MKRSILILLLFACSITFAQNNTNSKLRSIHGIITNAEGKPVIGIKLGPFGVSFFTFDDANGNFDLNIPRDMPVLLELRRYGWPTPLYVKILPTDKNANILINKELGDVSAKNLAEWRLNIVGNTQRMRDAYVAATNEPAATTAQQRSSFSDAEIRIDEPVGNADVKNVTGDDNTIHTAVEIEPKFKTGFSGWADYVKANLKYPKTAIDNNIQGKVYVTFVVEKDGSLSDIKIVRDICDECGAEVVRLMKASPKWSPGVQNGKAVRTQYTLPINFSH